MSKIALKKDQFLRAKFALKKVKNLQNVCKAITNSGSVGVGREGWKTHAWLE